MTMESIDIQQIKRTISKPTEKLGIRELLGRDIKFGSSGLSDKAKEALYTELSVLLKAGLDIRTALDMTAHERPYKEAADIEKLKDNIISGSSLSQALQLSAKFSPYEFHSVQIGEETGQLPTVLDELARLYGRKIQQKRQIVGALTYPIAVLSMAVGAVVFMLYFIVPMFSDIFARFGGDLPGITKAVISASAYVSEWALVWLAFFGVLAVAAFSVKETEAFQKIASALLIRIPIFGPIILKAQLARLCSMMALLISAKVHLVRALELAGSASEFYPIRKSLPEISKKIISGSSLHSCLAEHPIFDRKMVSLIKVGEEVNKLDDFFDRIATQYSAEIDHRIKTIGTLIEPVLLIVLGGVVGLILIAMYLPLFRLSTSLA